MLEPTPLARVAPRNEAARQDREVEVRGIFVGRQLVRARLRRPPNVGQRAVHGLWIVVELHAVGGVATAISCDRVEHVEAREDVIGDRAHRVRRAKADHVRPDRGLRIEALRCGVLNVLQRIAALQILGEAVGYHHDDLLALGKARSAVALVTDPALQRISPSGMRNTQRPSWCRRRAYLHCVEARRLLQLARHRTALASHSLP